MVLIEGKKYYNVEEAAGLAGVSVRTLRRWLSAGRLSEFLYAFRAGSNEVLYRLEEPEEGEPVNEKGEHVMPEAYRRMKKKGGVPNEGVGST